MDARARCALLLLARDAIKAAIDPRLPRPDLERMSKLIPELGELSGAFVSLHDPDGSVRGCVGTTVREKPIAEVVATMAEAAALRDPRFLPVDPEELATLEIENLVLGPIEPLRKGSEIEIGVHGLLVSGFGRRGLLLPQVASERDWDFSTFAEQTCRKAGLPPDAYRDPGVELFRFTAEIINEKEIVHLIGVPPGDSLPAA